MVSRLHHYWQKIRLNQWFWNTFIPRRKTSGSKAFSLPFSLGLTTTNKEMVRRRANSVEMYMYDSRGRVARTTRPRELATVPMTYTNLDYWLSVPLGSQCILSSSLCQGRAPPSRNGFLSAVAPEVAQLTPKPVCPNLSRALRHLGETMIRWENF